MSEFIKVHPIFNRAMSYSEHFEGNLTHLGDSLGSDCQVQSFCFGSDKTTGMLMLYKNDGSKNEDWYTYGAEVLAPITGKVTNIYINEIVNTPGKFKPSRASCITITNDEGTNVVLAHVTDSQVKEGDYVVEGQVIAYASNNGCSRSPHVHIGAYKGKEPLQIVFDLHKMGKIVEEVGEEYYLTGQNKK